MTVTHTDFTIYRASIFITLNVKQSLTGWPDRVIKNTVCFTYLEEKEK